MSEQFDYDLMEKEERPFAQRLVAWIANHLHSTTMVDLGAGTGVYVEEARLVGMRAQGYDICTPQPRPHCVTTQNMFQVTDPAHCVLCLEVAEHCLDHLGKLVIDAVWRNTRPGGWVVWSAAQPGQGGVGHVNCRYPEYWRNLAREAGFELRPPMEWDLHQYITQGYHMGWFRLNKQLWYRPL